MKARDIMTDTVLSVCPDTSVSQVAGLLLDRGISAVPVVDSDGAPLGMVSEGDLIGRDEAARAARRDWWLALFAEGQPLSDAFMASLKAPERKARDVMSAPLVTVGEETEVGEIARLLAAHRIKRVPVVRDGRVIGIVSRADLLRALAAVQPDTAAAENVGPGSGLRGWVDEHFHGPHRNDHQDQPTQASASDSAGLRVENFRRMVADFNRGEVQHREDARRSAAEQRQSEVKNLIDHHIADESWRSILQKARLAAGQGQTELMLLRFPSQLCIDGGRAINAMEVSWPGTLRGEAAEIYLRWEHNLRPHGFRLAARILDYPGGIPGNAGLFLVWGE
ncbi:MAG: CBS domain-containing protein [Alphaproteobacteria bacterium]|nr:CBS domain-containing protein [Alphaproteobacteria bacterium]